MLFKFPDCESNKKSKFNKQVVLYMVFTLRIIFYCILIGGSLYKYLSNVLLYLPFLLFFFFLSLRIKWQAIKPGCYIWCIQTSGVDSIMILITTLSVTWWQVDTEVCVLQFYFLAFYCYTTGTVIWSQPMLPCFLCFWFRPNVLTQHTFFSRYSR